MLNRRWFLQGVSATLLVAPGAVAAQQAGKVYRLGMLGRVVPPIKERPMTGTIVSKLRELGWEEGRNLSIDTRFAESLDSLPQVSRSLIALKPDVLVALDPYAVHALKDATPTIPIVFFAASDPVDRELVSSLARPGGNITGVSHYVGPGMGAKPAELLKELVPRAQRMAWLINPLNPFYHTASGKGIMERRGEELKRLKLRFRFSVSKPGHQPSSLVPSRRLCGVEQTVSSSRQTRCSPPNARPSSRLRPSTNCRRRTPAACLSLAAG